MSTTSLTWTIRSGADLGRAVAAVRAENNLTQEQAAELTGVPRTYLAKLEVGMTVVLVERILRVLRRLGAEVTVSLSQSEPDGA